MTSITVARGYAPAVAKRRLDTLLAERGIYESRSRAAAAVMAGEVRLGGRGGELAAKPGQLVADDVEIAVSAPPPYVSRGGEKLALALDALALDASTSFAQSPRPDAAR